jgi:hypothetical protein
MLRNGVTPLAPGGAAGRTYQVVVRADDLGAAGEPVPEGAEVDRIDDRTRTSRKTVVNGPTNVGPAGEWRQSPPPRGHAAAGLRGISRAVSGDVIVLLPPCAACGNCAPRWVSSRADAEDVYVNIDRCSQHDPNPSRVPRWLSCRTERGGDPGRDDSLTAAATVS